MPSKSYEMSPTPLATGESFRISRSSQRAPSLRRGSDNQPSSNSFCLLGQKQETSLLG